MLDITMSLRFLSPDEIKQKGLEDNELYLIAFLVNAKQNNSGDPVSFKVAESAVSKITGSSIGKPWIGFPPIGYENKHIYHLAEDPTDPKSILNFQKKFATGVIIDQFINPETKNANVIIKVFKEYKDKVINAIKDNKLLPYVSNLLAINSVNVNNEVDDGEILHLQSVQNPGYEKSISKINGVCSGMLKECAEELKVLGSTGNLLKFQRDVVFIKEELPIISMTTNEEINQMINSSLEKILPSLTEKLVGSVGQILATKTVESQVGVVATSNDTESIKTELELVKAENIKIANEFAKQTEAIRVAKRTQQVQDIIEAEIRLKFLSEKEREARSTQLFELKKDGSEELEDLNLLAKTLMNKAQSIKKVAGSSRYVDDSTLGSNTIDHMSLFGEMK